MTFAADKKTKKTSDLVIPVIYLDVSINFAQPIKAGVEQAEKDQGVKTIFDGSVNFNIDQQEKVKKIRELLLGTTVSSR